MSDVLGDRRQAPRTQQGVVLGANKQQNYVDKPKPDRSQYDITGRYEVVTLSHKYLLGQTLVINQAGTHIQGVHSWVHKPPLPKALSNQQKGVFRFHGDLKGNKYSGLYYGKGFAGDYIDIVQKDDRTLLVDVTYRSGFVEKLVFTKTSSRATNLSIDVAEAAELIKRYEWAPLLSVQLSNMAKHFSGSKLRTFDELLNEYWNPVSFNDPQGEQRDTAKKISNFFGDMFSRRDRGVHPHDSILTGYYLKALLTAKPWAPDGLDRLTRYDYLQRMIEQEQIREIKGDVSTVRGYLNLPKLDENIDLKKFVYKVSLKLYGATAKTPIGGGNFLKGTLTIEKTKGDGNWPIGVEAKYSTLLFGFAVGAGAGLTTISGKSEFSAPIEWLYKDFSGWGGLALTNASLNVPPAKASISAFFIIAERARGTFQVEFIERNLDPAKLSKKPRNPLPSADLSYNKIRFGEPNATAKLLKLEPSEIKKDYAILYGKNMKTFNGYDSAVLTDGARQLIRWVCASELPVLMEPNVRIVVKGYSDRVGSEEYNYRLALNRAINVKQAIVDIMGSKLGVDADAIISKSLGESEAQRSGDPDDKENPQYRGAKVLINGRVVLTLQEAYL